MRLPHSGCSIDGSFTQWLSASDHLSGYATRSSNLNHIRNAHGEKQATRTANPDLLFSSITSAKSYSLDADSWSSRQVVFAPRLEKTMTSIGLWKLVFELECILIIILGTCFSPGHKWGGNGDAQALFHTSCRCFGDDIGTHVFLKLFHVCELFTRTDEVFFPVEKCYAVLLSIGAN